MIQERELSAREWDAYKAANRAQKRRIMIGTRIRENSALEEKIRVRKLRAKKKAKRKLRNERNRLRSREKTPMIQVAG